MTKSKSKSKSEMIEPTADELEDYILKAYLQLISSLERRGFSLPDTLVAPTDQDEAMTDMITKAHGIKRGSEVAQKDKKVLMVVESVGTDIELKPVCKDGAIYYICAISDQPRNGNLYAGHYIQTGTKVKLPW